MDLRVLLPDKTVWQGKVKKIVGEAIDGSFCLLPAHIDFVTILTSGIFYTVTEDNKDTYLAVNEGILIKIGSEVTVTTRNAVPGEDLNNLKKQVAQDFQKINEQDRHARNILQKLEADFVRRFLDLEAHA